MEWPRKEVVARGLRRESQHLRMQALERAQPHMQDFNLALAAESFAAARTVDDALQALHAAARCFDTYLLELVGARPLARPHPATLPRAGSSAQPRCLYVVAISMTLVHPHSHGDMSTPDRVSCSACAGEGRATIHGATSMTATTICCRSRRTPSPGTSPAIFRSLSQHWQLGALTSTP